MTDPVLTESAWSRAKADTSAAYKSAEFNISLALLAVLAGGAAVVMTDGREDTATRTAGPILAGVAAIVLALIAVLAFQVAMTPFRQRDELRKRWSSSAPPSSHVVELKLRNLRRKGEDLLRALKAGSLGTNGQKAVETWTEETFAFMSEHCDPALATQFIDASRGTTPFIPSVAKRLHALDRVIESQGQ
jgi:hypothetical protein